VSAASLAGPFGARPRTTAVLAATSLSLSGILFVVSGASPSTATVFRCLYALPVLALLAWREDRALGGPRPWRVRRWAFLAGVFFAVDLVLFHHGILLMGAGLSTVMSNLQVVFVLVAAWLIWGERPGASQMAGVPVALAGVVLIAGVLDERPYGRDPGLGVAIGLLVGASYAAYLLLIRKGRDRERFAGPILDATVACMLTAGAAGLVAGELDLVPSWPAHLWLVALALGVQATAGPLLAIALPRLPAVTTSLLLLVQPVLSVVLAMVLIAEAPSAVQLLGVGLVLVGVLLGSLPWDRVRERRRPRDLGLAG
jgi:drug/metabolite transporter (DMT)-like permease